MSSHDDGAGEVLLRLDEVSARYGGIIALDGVSLHVRRGEMVAMLGPNGGGKSTVLRVIVGLHPDRDGQVRHRGTSLLGVPTEKIVSRGIAMVPEGRGVLAGMSVRDNLLMGTYHRSVSAAHERELLERMTTLFPALDEKLGLKAANLSGGQKQMLVIARALMAEPELLILDEPSFGLAPLIVREVFETLATLRDEQGLTVLVAEQMAVNALRVVDRGYVLYRGRIVLEGNREELSHRERLEAAYLGATQDDHTSADERATS